MLQRLYATVWYTNIFGESVMKNCYSKDETDDLIGRLTKANRHYTIEYD